MKASPKGRAPPKWKALASEFFLKTGNPTTGNNATLRADGSLDVCNTIPDIMF